MLRRCVLTVFGETDSSPAISGRDRFVGRYRSTRSARGLSSSAGGDGDCSLAAGDEPCRMSRMSASSAPCADGPADLPDYAPIPRSALGPALNDQGYYVGRVERNLYWVTDGVY